MLKGLIIGNLIGSTRIDKNKTNKLFPSNSQITYLTINAIASYYAIKEDNSYSTMKENFKKHLIFYGNKYFELYNSCEEEYLSFLFRESNQEMNLTNGMGLISVCPIVYLNKNQPQSASLAKTIASIFNKGNDNLFYSEAFITSLILAKNKTPFDLFKREMQRFININFKLQELISFKNDIKHCVLKSLVCLVNSTDFASCFYNALSINADVLTYSLIGMLAELYYGVPIGYQTLAKQFLKDEILDFFNIE